MKYGFLSFSPRRDGPARFPAWLQQRMARSPVMNSIAIGPSGGEGRSLLVETKLPKGRDYCRDPRQQEALTQERPVLGFGVLRPASRNCRSEQRFETGVAGAAHGKLGSIGQYCYTAVFCVGLEPDQPVDIQDERPVNPNKAF